MKYSQTLWSRILDCYLFIFSDVFGQFIWMPDKPVKFSIHSCVKFIKYSRKDFNFCQDICWLKKWHLLSWWGFFVVFIYYPNLYTKALWIIGWVHIIWTCLFTRHCVAKKHAWFLWKLNQILSHHEGFFIDNNCTVQWIINILCYLLAPLL